MYIISNEVKKEIETILKSQYADIIITDNKSANTKRKIKIILRKLEKSKKYEKITKRKTYPNPEN